MSACYYRLKR